MKTPFGTEIDLGPGHIVLDGDPAFPRERGTVDPPLFGPCLLWPRSPISASTCCSYLYTNIAKKLGPVGHVVLNRCLHSTGAAPPYCLCL